MSTIAVTPVIGEFGYLVFDVQPRIRHWLRERQANRKVVFAPKECASFFEEATEVIDLPRELLPDAPATMRSITYEHWTPGSPERLKIERLVEWAKSQVQADAWLDIPYFEPGAWNVPATFALLEKDFTPPDEPYVVIAARARAFDAWRNWPTHKWDELTGRIREKWKVGLRCIGRPPATYFPQHTVPQETSEADRLDQSIGLLNHAVCSISSNSGPTHLSLMAGCPTFAWGEPYLEAFMERYTNPLGTPCRLLPAGWDPGVDEVWTALDAWYQKLGRRPTPADRRAPRLSMCMIARQSGRTIKAALDSVKPWVDEMIVVDTGSTDDTARIARDCGADVFHEQWQDSFALARNQSLRRASGRWLFWMDSDDTIQPEDGVRLRQLVEQEHSPSTLGFTAKVCCPTANSDDPYATATVVDHVKVVRNLPALGFTGRIHEQVLPAIRGLGGVVKWTDVRVQHSGSDQSPESRQRKQARDLRLLQLETQDDPDNTFALFNVGMTLLDMSRPTEALDPLSRSLQLSLPGESHVRKIYALLTQAYADLGRRAAALHTCLQGLAACPGDPELLFRKGTLDQADGRHAQAEAAFLAVVGGDPSEHFSSIDVGILGVKAWHNLAVVYETQRRHDRARDAWRKVLGFDATNVTSWLGWIEATAAVAPQELAKIDTLGLEVPTAIRAIASAKHMARYGQTETAFAVLKSAVEKEKDGKYSELVLDELARNAFEYNRLDDADEALSEIVRRDPLNAPALHNLAASSLRQQDYAAAAEYAQRSLAVRPGHPPTERVLRDAQAKMASAEREPAEAAVTV